MRSDDLALCSYLCRYMQLIKDVSGEVLVLQVTTVKMFFDTKALLFMASIR